MHSDENDNQSDTTPITVRIVHVNTQTEGEKRDFCQSTITFGRNLSCDVVFPADLVIVSRLHAIINRRGNQYILKNLSANACYVNNIKKEECILKEGDFIAFADGGPVVIFTLHSDYLETDTGPDKTIVAKQANTQQKWLQLADNGSDPVTEPPTLLTRASADFTFQHGTCIKSFHQICVIVGNGSCCDFVIANPQVDEKQFQLHFKNNQYILRDLSELQSTLVNNDRVATDVRLESGDIITLNVDTVQLEYLGEGRVLEYNPQKYTAISISDELPDHTPAHAPSFDGHNPGLQGSGLQGSGLQGSSLQGSSLPSSGLPSSGLQNPRVQNAESQYSGSQHSGSQHSGSQYSDIPIPDKQDGSASSVFDVFEILPKKH